MVFQIQPESEKIFSIYEGRLANFAGVGVEVKVAVAVGVGVKVVVGVGVNVAVAVAVDVGVKVAVLVGVAVGSGANKPPNPQEIVKRLVNNKIEIKRVWAGVFDIFFSWQWLRG